MTAAVLVLTAVSADAGPLRNLVQRVTGRGGCGTCQQAAPQYAPPTYQPPVTMPQTGTVHLISYQHATSYAPPVAAGGVMYPPIRMYGATVPTCSGGTCR